MPVVPARFLKTTHSTRFLVASANSNPPMPKTDNNPIAEVDMAFRKHWGPARNISAMITPDQNPGGLLQSRSISGDKVFSGILSSKLEPKDALPSISIRSSRSLKSLFPSKRRS